MKREWPTLRDDHFRFIEAVAHHRPVVVPDGTTPAVVQPGIFALALLDLNARVRKLEDRAAYEAAGTIPPKQM